MPIMARYQVAMGELDENPQKIKGVGTGRTAGKRAVPFAVPLADGSAVRFNMMSNLMDPKAPRDENTLIIPLTAQIQLGLVKDVRSGTCFFKDVNKYTQMYSIKGSRLRAIFALPCCMATSRAPAVLAPRAMSVSTAGAMPRKAANCSTV